MNARHEELPGIFPANIRHFYNHRSGGRSHWHSEIELQYVVDGEATALCNLRPVPLKVGDILFVNTNELHAGNTAYTSNEFYCFHINRGFFSNFIGEEYVIFENLIQDVRCAELLDRVIECYKKGDFNNKVKAGRYLYEFFSVVTENYVKEVTGESEYKKKFKRSDKFNDIVKYIEDNLAEDLTVGAIAEHFFITPSHLSHFFKKKSGKSIIQYLNEARILKAKLYLEQYDMSVGEIAGEVGFDDINYFSRKFRQICGETPTGYRSHTKG